MQANRADQFSRNPSPDVRAVLVFGPDTGLARERIQSLTKSVVDDPSDPFLVMDLTNNGLKDDPARLMDEAAAISLMGGRRVVRVLDASDQVAGIFKNFLEDLAGDALVLVQAGDLTPRSSLRKLFEADKNAAALPCYADDERALGGVIQETLRRDKVTASPEALMYLVENLGSDRGQTRAELEKLSLYVGPGNQATLEDAMACVGDSSLLSTDRLVYAAVNGDANETDKALNRSLAEGVNAVAILRALARHLLRLQLVRAAVDDGKRLDDAVKLLRPPIFFRLAGPFRQQVLGWHGKSIQRALVLVLEAETSCKQSGMPAEAICGRTLLQVSRLAAAGQRRRAG